MDKITEALKNILPEDQVSDVAKAVEDMISEQYNALEAEFQTKLDEAYQQLSEEKESEEAIAEQGYTQAYQIITSLMSRLDEQREEFEQALEEGFDEAYQELQKEKKKNESLEVELYDEFDNKLKEMKEFFVDKIDQFLTLQESEIYEHAKRDILNDPTISEQRVAVAKMAEILSDYMSADDYAGVTSSKLEESQKAIEELRASMRIVEAKNVRLSAQNNKLNEQVRAANDLITEAAKIEKKNEKQERLSKTGTASGRGQRVLAEQEQIVVEQNTNKDQQVETLSEGNDELSDLLILSGIQEAK